MTSAGSRLAGKVAIVTGAGRGIGACIATHFVEQGARVVIAEIDPQAGEAVAAALRGRGFEALAVPTNVAAQASVDRMVAATLERFGPPNVLVNNAGIAVFEDPLKLTDDQWDRCFAVDLEGVWRCIRATLPHMLALGGGSVVNIASTHAFQVIRGCFPYPVAKHGLIGLTRALAMEYGARNVRFNAVCPSYVATRLTLDYWAGFPDPEAERRRAADLLPLKRVAEPDEVAWPVVFLASDESSFITGESLMVDGGRSVLFHD
jgi:NAD(P)-dependent dehydrogenase (short-subunit alcohol dehydrogenase family)